MCAWHSFQPSSLHRQSRASASLFDGAQLPPSQKRVLAMLKVDESVHIDQIVERLNAYLSSSEIFEALFELELSGPHQNVARQVLR
jgi:DNA processing protein